jgi:hypothetical protein
VSNPDRDDATQYMPKVTDPAPKRGGYMSTSADRDPVWQQRSFNESGQRDPGPNVPEGYMDSTNVPKQPVRPTGGPRLFLDALLMILGGLALAAVVIVGIKLLALLWGAL